jgi:hypothetical protein
VSRSETQSLYKTKKRTQQEKEGDETRERPNTGEGKICPHPFYLPSLTHVMPMNRAVREVSEGGEGNIKKIVLVFPSSSEPD